MRSPRSPSASPATFWSSHIAAWRRSGLSAREYATEHDLALPTLYGWSRRLRGARPAEAPAAPRLIPITLEAPTLCEWTFPEGGTLRFPASVDPAVLTAFVRAVSSR